jgi:hypothetical protein
MRTIHSLSGIRNHDCSIGASEDSPCVRPRGHCDWQAFILAMLKVRVVVPNTELLICVVKLIIQLELHRNNSETVSLSYLLSYGAEPFLRSCQLCSHSGNPQQF